MERQDFLPRTVLPGDNGLRDLPPTDRCPLDRTPTPRMEQNSDDRCPGNSHDNNECGCGCGNDSRTNGGGMEGGTCCVGYEGCGEDSWGLTGHPLAMVYAPCQAFRALYDPATALGRGTLFTELDLPLGGSEGAFTTVGCACRAERRKV